MTTGNLTINKTRNTPGRLLFTVKEAAERLGVAEIWLYQRTRKGLIPFRRLGRFVRFTEQDIQDIIGRSEKRTA